MTPKTKLQQTVTSLSARLPPITGKQAQWAYDHCLDKIAVKSRKSIYCLECGHSWKVNTPEVIVPLPECTCPNCAGKLELKSSGYYLNKNSTYFAILTTRKEFQVVRMFWVKKQMKKNQKANCWADEVMQHWIDPSGKVTTLSKCVQGLSQYYDQWIFDSKLEVRNQSYDVNKSNNVLRYNISPYKIYPGKHILPILKRNGFKGNLYDIPPHALFSMLLQNNYIETLLKTGQIKMMQYCYNHNYFDFNSYWPSIKIAIRHKYMINDPSMWIDHIYMLRQSGKNLTNPMIVCPADLNAEHDRLIRKQREVTRLKNLKIQHKEIQTDQVNYTKLRNMFFDLQFTDGEITIKPLKTVEEFMIEGDELNHCVFAAKYFNREDSLILSARTADDQRLETIEVSLSKKEVIQSRGKNNYPSQYHDRIVNLVRSNMNKVQSVKSVQHVQL